MIQMDFEELAKQFVRALRGGLTQRVFSRRLLYKSNVAYLWESGRNFPTAAVALEAAQATGIDVRGALRRFFRFEPGFLAGDIDPTTPASVAALLEDLRGGTPIQSIAERAGKNRFAVSRWLRGLAEPRLPDFFCLVEALSLRLLDLLAEMVDPALLPAASSAWRRLEAARTLLTETPEASAFLLALETQAYRALPSHRSGFLADLLGFSLALEHRCLDLLLGAGHIEMRQGRYEPCEVQSIDTRTSPAVGRQIKSFWTELGVERLQAGAEGLFSYNVFTVSDADYDKLCDMQRAYYRSLRAAIATSKPADRVVVTNLAMFPLTPAASKLP